MKSSHAIGLLIGAAALVISGSAVAVVGCGSTNRVTIDDDGGGSIDGGPIFTNGDAKEAHACEGLQCQQVACSGGGDTTVTGKVYAPNGKLALYNAIVYVPNSEPDPIVNGATCDKCGAVTGNPVVTALSDATGKFELKNVPVGKDIPLIIQIGKWRRKVTIPEVKECTENAVDAELTRLPKNRSEGSIPQIALTTGSCDKLGCMLPKIGIDTSEFGVEGDATKAVHVYKGGGGGPAAATSAQTFWTDASKLKKYDLIILSCECSENLGNKPQQAFDAMTDYLQSGGRIFTTDFMYTWYNHTQNTDFKSATNIRGGAPIGGSPMTIDTSFPKGQALSDWLASAAGITGGKVTPDVVFSNIISVDSSKAQQWADSPAPQPGPRVYSVNLPVGLPADQQCGKGVHIDVHANQSGTDQVDTNYPNTCNSPLKPAENLLAFFFFDISSCIQDEKEPPKPPPVK